MNRNFDSSNHQHLIYKHPPLEIAVLGGIRLEGLDRMRVTLKVGMEHLSIRHSFDLYNDSQTERMIRKIAERLEVGTSVSASALSSLTDLLEAWRLEELEKQQTTKEEKRKILTEKEVQKATIYLSAPNLMNRTKEDLGKCGIIGEEDNRLLMFLIFLTRKMNHPLHIISLGSSGAGKTHLQEKVAALVPEEDKREITTLSGNAFYYFGTHEISHKLIVIEDLDGAEDVLYPMREIKSKGKVTKEVVHKNTQGKAETVTLTVEGPVCIAGCTTKESLYEDNANRSFLIYIDESAEQDEQIMSYQRKLAAGKIDLHSQQEMIEFFKDLNRVLKPVQVRNPFAEQLKIPKEVFKPRRTNTHYLAFIEAVTFYHQFQREKQYDQETGEEFIETTLEDIQEANNLMKEVLLRKSDPLTGACRNYFERLKSYLKTKGENQYSAREIMREMRIRETTLRRYHQHLELADFITITKDKKYKGYKYELINDGDFKELRHKISTVLDEILAKLKDQSQPKKKPKK